MLKKVSYRTQTIVTTTVIVVLSLLISGIFFFYTYYISLKDHAYQQLNHSVESVVQNIEQKLTSISNAAFMFSSTPLVREWVNGTANFTGDTMAGYKNIANLRTQIESGLMFNDAWLSRGVDGVYMAVDGNFIPLLFRTATSLKTSEPVNRLVYEEVANLPENSFYYLLDTNKGIKEPAVFYIHRVNDTTQSKQLTFIFSVNSENITKVLSSLDENTTAHIIYKGKVLFSDDQSAIGEYISVDDKKEPQDKTIIKDTPYIMAYQKLDQKDFMVQVLTPHDYITSQIWPSLQIYINFALVLLVIFAVVAGVNASAHTMFMVELTQSLNKVEQEDYTVRLPSYSNKDLNTISTTFNNMTSSIQTLVKTVYQSEILQKENEIKLLQAQMNPHFLMNVLANISTLALLEDQQEIYEMVTALSTMLESALFSKDSGVTVDIKKELEYVKCYLYIQKVRAPESLDYNIYVEDAGLLDKYIPKLSLQPLVENAVIHGIEPKLEGGTVNVSIKRDNDDLLMIVEDDGVGFDMQAYVNQQQTKTETHKHIGIYNTNQRIKMLFGEEYGFDFETVIGEGTKAFIRIPMMDSPMEGEKTND